MRKFLLAATILAPFVVAPAFAGGNGSAGGTIAGNVSGTVSMSNSGLTASGGTAAGAMTAGNGASFQSVTTGNYATVGSKGVAMAGPGKAYTDTKTTESQSGATTAISNTKTGFGFGNLAAGAASGASGAQMTGGSTAAAGNLNGVLGVAVQQPSRPRGH
jgi:hypothetical protein